VAGLHAGLKWVEGKGLDSIYDHEMELTRQLVDGLKSIDGVTLYCQDDLIDHISVVCFNVDGLEALHVGTMLDVDHNIASRTGLHCAPLIHGQLGTDAIHGAVRFGIGPFNTAEHIQIAINAVREIARLKK
jgi:cysteine desulfurase/selenocysteine lyase